MRRFGQITQMVRPRRLGLSPTPRATTTRFSTRCIVRSRTAGAGRSAACCIISIFGYRFKKWDQQTADFVVSRRSAAPQAIERAEANLSKGQLESRAGSLDGLRLRAGGDRGRLVHARGEVNASGSEDSGSITRCTCLILALSGPSCAEPKVRSSDPHPATEILNPNPAA